MKKYLILTLFIAAFFNGISQTGNFTTPGAEWYYNWPVTSVVGDPLTYLKWEVTGDTVIQGQTCSVITPSDFMMDMLGNQYVYEADNKVYWYDIYYDNFTTLYDFNAQAGDTWTCGSQLFIKYITVDSVSTLQWEDHTYRIQYISGRDYNDNWNDVFIEGIGGDKELFPFFKDRSPSFLRCYLKNDELFYHGGEYECTYTEYSWEGDIADSYDGGSGTKTDPYQIKRSDQLALLAQQTNDGTGGDAYYKLTDHINLGRAVGHALSWTSIGTSEHPFTGHFDGGDFWVSKMYQNIDDDSESSAGGLFGFTKGAEIKNTTMFNCHVYGNARFVGTLVGYAGWTDIDNCQINIVQTVTTDGVAGGVAGFAGKPFGEDLYSDKTYKISNCTLDHSSNEMSIEGAIAAGGIVGQVNEVTGAYANYLISNCSTELKFDIGITSQLHTGGIVGRMAKCIVDGCINSMAVVSTHDEGSCGGIVGSAYSSTIFDCYNLGQVTSAWAAGGIIGFGSSKIKLCYNKGVITCNGVEAAYVGGICGIGAKSITNCYNRGNLSATIEQPYSYTSCYIGGICGYMGTEIRNVYNYCVITPPDLSEYPSADIGYGKIVAYEYNDTLDYNCYWLYHWYYYNDTLPANGNPNMTLQGSCHFEWDPDHRVWLLEEPQHETYDFIEALNAGAMDECLWLADVNETNGGYPIFTPFKNKQYPLLGDEWYYEITGETGDVTYQHLEYASDSTLSHKKVKIIVKTNTLYDKNSLTDVVTEEYICEVNECVYWWDNQRKDFTVLYNFAAVEGDEWTITYGNDSIVMHVYEVGETEYNGRTFKTLTVRDENDIFSGTIVCGVGHLTSFFPEKLLENKGNYEVNGLRCYWKEGNLLYKEGEPDCDRIYNNHHIGIDEIYAENEFTIYPNPTNDVFFVLSENIYSEYRITNLMGQTLMIGKITSENHQIDVSSLPEGMYFITIGGRTTKFLKK